MDLRSELNKRPKILVIDDELANFEVIEALLHKENYQLYYANSSQQCFEHIATIQPDVILLDVMMPEIDGIEVCRKIKQDARWQNIPVLMVTALNNKKDLAKCLSSNADDLISKPLTGLELRTRVRVMVKVSQQYQTIQTMHQQLQASQLQLVQPAPESVLALHPLPVQQFQQVLPDRSIVLESHLPCYTN